MTPLWIGGCGLTQPQKNGKKACRFRGFGCLNGWNGYSRGRVVGSHLENGKCNNNIIIFTHTINLSFETPSTRPLALILSRTL